MERGEELSTITNGIRAYQIHSTMDNTNIVLYLNPDFNSLSFNEDNTLKVEVSNNYIKTYEVIENE